MGFLVVFIFRRREKLVDTLVSSGKRLYFDVSFLAIFLEIFLPRCWINIKIYYFVPLDRAVFVTCRRVTGLGGKRYS